MSAQKIHRFAALSSLGLMLSLSSALAQTPVEFTLAVEDFQPARARAGAEVKFKLSGPKHPANAVGLKWGDLQRIRDTNIENTIRVPKDGAAIRIKIAPAPQGGTYRVVDVAFQRADKTEPNIVFWSADNVVRGESPFIAVKMAGDTLEFKVAPRSRGQLTNPPSNPHTDNKYYTTYKYSILVQDSNGVFGVIDPEVETETVP